MSFCKTIAFLFLLHLVCLPGFIRAGGPEQTNLEKLLLKESPATLAKLARSKGDPARGAMAFYQPHLACFKCHSTGDKPSPLGPDLSKLGKDIKDTYLVESLLKPSKEIKKEYKVHIISSKAGKLITGILTKETPKHIELKQISQTFTISKKDIDEHTFDKNSYMPTGLVNQLSGKQEFLDLVRFLMEISEGGANRAQELRPLSSLFAAAPLPEYERNLDHAGLISDLDKGSFNRGEEIYKRVCANCHGTFDKAGSMPTSLKFASGKFKHGSDPYKMYQTITKGYGMMAPQSWMVPRQKYDVIHYIREAYLKNKNSSQYAQVTKAYLAGLPKGTERGPLPSKMQPWVRMNYGPNLNATYEIGKDGSNFAYKGIAVRLDDGPGGVSQGRYWMVFDQDTMRVAAAWSGKGFIDWNNILFNGRHAIHSRIVGRVHFENKITPGWANPNDGSFKDVRLVGRDNRRYGPLPRKWAHYKGMYHFGNKVISSYTVGATKILEMPGVVSSDSQPVFTRTFNIGPREKDLVLQVAQSPSGNLLNQSSTKNYHFVEFGTGDGKQKPNSEQFCFNGSSFLEIRKAKAFDFLDKDLTIWARIKTRKGGTILAKTQTNSEWVRDGKTFFVRGGRLCYDIGWVGNVESKTRVNDGKWHEVAMTYSAKSGKVSLFVDGKKERTRELQAKSRKPKHVLRIGFTAPNFPRGKSFFEGEISEVRFYQRALSEKEISKGPELKNDSQLVGRWSLEKEKAGNIPDISGNKHSARMVRGTITSTKPSNLILAGVSSNTKGLTWITEKENLRLKIPAGKNPLRFTLCVAGLDSQDQAEKVAANLPVQGGLNLKALTKGGPPRWTEEVETMAQIGPNAGPFAVDVLTHPAKNPWNCRVRLSGLDFFPGGKRAAICTWDGSVFLVDGVDAPENGLTWKRIASGMFQPLGLKIVDNKIYVTCRDQIAILQDLNGDGETDFYQNFNNDHQVTEHFHEFAMGLQTDKEGNFYYARGARHAKTPLVPHHGTLLKVSKDGSKTEIIATGFRAPNGVCVNPDGTFFVSDQEGHWIPKNRINWITKGGFYGNMWGYTDITDTSDDAMEPPVCWITNSFDRSPAEQIWVTSKKWGPLQGSLLNFSYGYGKVFIVPHEKVNGKMQGGMCVLPLPRFPTGVMRGQFHPENGQLYACGLFGWAGNQNQPGGFYRIRYTGKPVFLPKELKARKRRLLIQFTGELDAKTASNADNYRIETWDLRRTAGYGSRHHNEKSLNVQKAVLQKDGKTVVLEVPDIQPTWCMEIRYTIKGKNGESIQGVINNSIHHIGE